MTMLALLLEDSAPDAAGFTLSWLDWVAVGLGGGFMLLGILRGLWWQVIRFVGLLASAALARTFADDWGGALMGFIDISMEVAVGVVWVGLFLLGIVITAFIGTLGKKSLEVMQLGLMDRAGGAIAGLATGLFIHTAFLVALAYLGPQPWTDRALDETYSRSILQFVTTRHGVLAKGDSESTEALQQWLGSGGAISKPSNSSSGAKVK